MELIGFGGSEGVGGSIYIYRSIEICGTMRKSTTEGGGDHQFGVRVRS